MIDPTTHNLTTVNLGYVAETLVVDSGEEAAVLGVDLGAGAEALDAGPGEEVVVVSDASGPSTVPGESVSLRFLCIYQMINQYCQVKRYYSFKELMT